MGKNAFTRQLILTVYQDDRRLLTKAFEKGPVVIGRQPGSDLVLEFPFVSRTHCQVIEENGNFYLVDLGSRNGMLINGRKVDKYPLFDGISFTLEGLRVDMKVIGPASAGGPTSHQESIETVVVRRSPSKR